MRQRSTTPTLQALFDDCPTDQVKSIKALTDSSSQCSTQDADVVSEPGLSDETDSEIQENASHSITKAVVEDDRTIRSLSGTLIAESNTIELNSVDENLQSIPIYEPLSPFSSDGTSSHEIRLLLIPPTSDAHSELCGSLTTFQLSTAPSFIAVSYEWEGLQTVREMNMDIQIGEYKLPLKPNLAQALTCFQKHFSKPTYVWVDAICINQADVRERGHQVQIMKEIYRAAGGVWVWLGPASHDSDLAMDVFDEVASFPEDMKGEHSRSIRWIRRILYSPEYSAHRLSLYALFRRSYWRRLWIVQEVVLGACTDTPKICCGNRISALGHVMKLAKGIRAVSDADRVYNSWKGLTIQKLEMAIKITTDLADHIEEYCDDPEGGKSSDLLALLKRYSGKQCSEPRDKIYALFGLAGLESDSMLVDYSLPLKEVCRRATVHIIEGSQRVEILSLCLNMTKASSSINGMICDGSSTPVGPSWVPEWSQDVGLQLWPVTRVNQVPDEGKPGYDKPAKVIQGKALEVAAMFCGHIIEEIPIWRAGAPSSEKDHLQRVLQFLYRLLLSFEEKLTFSSEELMQKEIATGDLLYRLLFMLGTVKKRRQEEPTDQAEHPHVDRDTFITWASQFLSGKASSVEYPAGLRDFVKQPQRTLFVYRAPASKSAVNHTHSFGLSLADAQQNDRIVVIPTCDYPILLRKSSEVLSNLIATELELSKPCYEVVGSCYISNPTSFDLEVFSPRKRSNLRYDWKNIVLL